MLPLLAEDSPLSGFTAAQIATMVSGSGVALATAIAVLWRTIHSLYHKVITLSEEVGELKGKQAGVEALSNQVLDRLGERE
ncbi:hypothetical protein U8335_04045 [Roseiconus lacunae]|uniref:hypothetical protein n=1 Tax=Roseiconus lacunae TaxID=2605694 RepID=UPI00308B1BB1|nr:hypothetical protein U8335_04045 [Stieleria sp. HD01]